MIDLSALQIWFAVLIGWLDRQERDALAYLLEEDRILRAQLGGRRLRLTDDDRRRLAVRAFQLGRRALQQVATIVTPDTVLRWHRQLVARKWTYARRSPRRDVLAEIRRLVMRMAQENPTWGYMRIQGALKNVGHRVGRSTIARILKTGGLPPVPERPTSWQTFLRAHKDAIAGADFFATEVWTWRGLVTVYTVFVIHLAFRRVCMREAGIRIVQTPYQAPNANAYAERFVWSIKEECLDRIIPLGEHHFLRAVREYVAHYHVERNHQGLGNTLIAGAPAHSTGSIRRRPRLGGLLNYYERAA